MSALKNKGCKNNYSTIWCMTIRGFAPLLFIKRPLWFNFSLVAGILGMSS